MSDCGHDHRDDPLQALTCRAARELRAAGDYRPVGAIILRDGPPAVSAMANSAGLMEMAKAFCALGAQLGRDPDCPECAEAHDRMVQALRVLDLPPGRC